MRSSGVTLEEIRRLFKTLEESKSNDSMQILIDNEMCKQFQDIIETIVSSKDKKDKEIERLRDNIEILQDDLGIIGKELGLEEGSCFEDVLDKIERLNNITDELDKLIEQYSKNEYYYKYNGKYLKSEIINDLKQLKEGK